VTKRAAPPSASRGAGADGRGGRRVDVREWLGGIRLSGFMIIMFGLVVLAVLVLAPTIGTYVDQRQRIAALEHQVQLTQAEIADLQAQQQRWNDPAFIRTQARERLYYTQPGEIIYLVDNDLSEAQQPREQDAVSDDVEQTRTDWMAQLVRSLVAAGTAQTATGPQG